MRTALIIIFSFLTNISFAQKTHIVQLEVPEALNLQGFHIAKVIDDRVNKSSIGVVQKGMANRQVNAAFPDQFESYLHSFFNKLIPDNGGNPFIIKVNNLVISERTSAFSELGLAVVELEFLKEEAGELLSYGSFNSSVEDKAADVTGKHDERIVEAIIKCINQFSSSGWKDKQPVQENAIADNDNLNIAEVNLKRGLYRNFNDLVTNSPLTDQEFTIEPLKGKRERYIVREKGGGKKIKNLFGFSDGENIYLNASRYTQATYFVKSKLIGRYIYFEDKYTPAAAQAAGYAFGAIGGAAAAASANETGIVLNMQTGITIPLTQKEMRQLVAHQPELLKLYNESKKGPEVERLIIEKLNERIQ